MGKNNNNNNDIFRAVCWANQVYDRNNLTRDVCMTIILCDI